MSASDRQWLETRFRELADKIDGKDSKIHKLDVRLNTLEVGSIHRCSEVIERHEAKSWAHNPYKATGMAGGLVAIVEGVRKFFGH